MLFTYGELSDCLIQEPGPMTLPCLTLHAHWAAAIFQLGKDVENRTWSTEYRGPLAIHAGAAKRIDRKICGQLGLDPDALVSGHILGTVELVEVVRGSRSGWAMAGYYHWVLANPTALTYPLPHRGKMGLHRVSMGSDVHAYVEAAPRLR